MADISFLPLAGWRVIAEPDALDAATWPGATDVVRISADDAFAIGGAAPEVSTDPHAIVTPEHGFSGAVLSAEQVTHLAVAHIEWSLPGDRPAVAQGLVAGVPAKLVLRADRTALLLVAAAARQELADRIGGR